MLVQIKLPADAPVLTELSAAQLAALSTPIRLPNEEPVRLSFEFAADVGPPPEVLPPRDAAERRSTIIFSKALVRRQNGTLTTSPHAQDLIEQSWSSRVALALVGLVDEDPAQVDGLDDTIAVASLTADGLLHLVQRLVRRLWFKLPPGPNPTPRPPEEFEVRQITRLADFTQCLRLRYEVYSELGYVDPDIVAAGSNIELDAYDPTAIHYGVLFRGDLVGAMRLVIPLALQHQHMQHLVRAPYGEWCEQLANAETSGVYRRRLQGGQPGRLPILDSFDYFRELEGQETYRQLIEASSETSEISRVVVHPQFRANKLLDLLMKQAEQTARKARQCFLLLECAPFHESMYAKYDYARVSNEGRPYHARALRTDIAAVAMLRCLTRDHHTTRRPRDDHASSVHVTEHGRSAAALRPPSRGRAGRTGARAS